MDDELIRETLLEQTEVLPIPPGVWAKLEQGLPRADHGTWVWRTPRPVKLGMAAALLCGLLLTAGGITWQSRPLVDKVPAGAPAQVALTIEESAIVDQAVDQPTHFEYTDRIPKAVREKRAAWRSGTDLLLQVNQALKPFGFRVEAGAPGMGDTLYQGDTVLLTGVMVDGRAAVSDKGDDFALVLDTPGSGAKLLRPTGLTPWDVGKHLFQGPAFAGSDLLEVTALGEQLDAFAILKGGQAVYRGNLGQWGPELPLKRLAGWNGHWVLEVSGQVVMDGQSLNQQLGDDEIFDWQVIAGKPFFFFKQDGKVGINYDGKAQPGLYDEVIHYRCCEPAAFNPGGNASMVWFHARKGSLWYYVEAGVYN